MKKKIVHLSDTSHPFTTYVDESDNTDNDYRTLTSQEFSAIRAFQSKWGYVGNHDVSDALVDMLADTTSDASDVIRRFMHMWDLTGPGYDGIRTDLQNLFVLRATVMPDSSYEIPTFTADEIKALESLEGEKPEWKTERQIADESVERGREFLKTIESSRRQLFREEANKRVNRYFIGQTGWAWFVHYIGDMPEKYDENLPNMTKSLYRAKDGMSTLHMTSLYMSEDKAWEALNMDILLNAGQDKNFLIHVVELDKM